MKSVFFNDKVLSAENSLVNSLTIPPIILMENAGANSAKYIISNYSSEIKNEIIILSGKGNNAGDGFVIARHFIGQNLYVKVLMLYRKNELKGDALVNYTILENFKSPFLKISYCKNEKDLLNEIGNENKLIVDSVFGVGFKGKPDLRIRKIISAVNNLKNKKIISADTPSCLSNFSQNTECIKADVTLAMGVKKFHSVFYSGKEYSGKTKLINIGFPDKEFDKFNEDKIFETEISDVKSFLPVRNADSYKYNNGKVFILSGSPGLTGAAYLCSMAALRTGSGAVITGIPESLNDIMEIKLTEVMTLPLPETKESTLSESSYDLINEKFKWADCVLIGPGLSKNNETGDLIRRIVKENDLNFVLDADAIFAFRENLNLLKNKKIILTPHMGEFSNLTGIGIDELKADFYRYAKDFSKKYNVILVLKNSPAIISDGNYFIINSTGKENLATAGTGDVLSGIIASLVSQSSELFKSAVSGVFIHGMCGDNIYEISGGSSTIASELLNEIPSVINFIRNN